MCACGLLAKTTTNTCKIASACGSSPCRTPCGLVLATSLSLDYPSPCIGFANMTKLCTRTTRSIALVLAPSTSLSRVVPILGFGEPPRPAVLPACLHVRGASWGQPHVRCLFRGPWQRKDLRDVNSAASLDWMCLLTPYAQSLSWLCVFPAMLAHCYDILYKESHIYILSGKHHYSSWAPNCSAPL